MPSDMALPVFRTARRESLPPDETKSADIFARLGYRFADALADLVDNSVDASAKNVHIRFIRSGDGIHGVVIADNGVGMSADELMEAMRFGSRNRKSSQSLGKYGIGLKSASLSQADRVTVLTRRVKSTIGRRWTLANVKDNWSCDVLHDNEVAKAFGQTFGEFKISRTGTIVYWEELEHLRALPNHVDDVLANTKKELMTELGIRFHRFLESGQLSISIDEQFGVERPSGIPTYVSPLDPFGYEQAPHRDYPICLPLKVGRTVFTAECHIWPPKSRAPNYRLGGGKVALRQGFYFYRNDRLIQAGGWNRVRADDSEPHFSLARVKVDLPPELDSLFKLDVAKSRLDPAPEFIRAVLAAKDDRGVTFEEYIDQAETVYRKQKSKDKSRFPVVPGSGIPASARRAIATVLKESGAQTPKKVAFKWTRLDSDELVQVDAAGSVIYLNSRFRNDLAEGGRGDAPVLKVALMFLLQDEFGKAFFTKASTERLQRLNLALIASLKA